MWFAARVRVKNQQVNAMPHTKTICDTLAPHVAAKEDQTYVL